MCFSGTDGIINGTMAIMVTDLDLFVTPFNTSMLNPHMYVYDPKPSRRVILTFESALRSECTKPVKLVATGNEAVVFSLLKLNGKWEKL